MSEGIFTPEAQRVITAAFSAARSCAHSCLCTEHLLLGLCQCGGEEITALFAPRRLTADRIKQGLAECFGKGQGPVLRVEISRETAEAFKKAALEAAREGKARISCRHLLSAMLEDPSCGAFSLLEKCGVRPSELLSEIKRTGSAPANAPRPKEPKLLLQYGRDMTAMAARGAFDPLVGRRQELERVMRVLCRRKKGNPVLLGEAGVGKTAVAEGFACLLQRGAVPAPLRGMRLFSLDMSSLVAGTKYRGEFEEKVRNITSEAVSCGNIILFIDEMHTLAGAGAAEGAIDAGNILKPVLARGGVKIMGATTPSEYRRYIRRDQALERRFQPIEISETGREDTLAVLRSCAYAGRRYYGVEAGEEILGEIESLCRRFLPQRYFPDKAVDVLEEASAMALTEGRTVLDLEHIKRVVAQMSGIPAAAGVNGMVSPSELEERISQKFIGQKRAVSCAVSAVCSALAFPGMSRRPRGIMLFCGPSGTGKTFLAKTLAECLFDDQKSLLRFDMSEYREAYSVSKLIGAPPGYAGYGRGGLLTEAVRGRPFSVLLFDELEKAHPEVLSLLLQVLEDGVLTDSEGMSVSFKNTIIIMTSNMGFIMGSVRGIGFGRDRGESELKDRLSKLFPPELVNRIDKIIPFEPLSKKDLEKVARNMLSAMEDRLGHEGVRLKWDEEACLFLAGISRDSREVRANISALIEEPLAKAVLKGTRFIDIHTGEDGPRLLDGTVCGIDKKTAAK